MSCEKLAHVGKFWNSVSTSGFNLSVDGNGGGRSAVHVNGNAWNTAWSFKVFDTDARIVLLCGDPKKDCKPVYDYYVETPNKKFRVEVKTAGWHARMDQKEGATLTLEFHGERKMMIEELDMTQELRKHDEAKTAFARGNLWPAWPPLPPPPPPPVS